MAYNLQYSLDVVPRMCHDSYLAVPRRSLQDALQQGCSNLGPNSYVIWPAGLLMGLGIWQRVKGDRKFLDRGSSMGQMVWPCILDWAYGANGVTQSWARQYGVVGSRDRWQGVECNDMGRQGAEWVTRGSGETQGFRELSRAAQGPIPPMDTPQPPLPLNWSTCPPRKQNQSHLADTTVF